MAPSRSTICSNDGRWSGTCGTRTDAPQAAGSTGEGQHSRNRSQGGKLDMGMGWGGRVLHLRCGGAPAGPSQTRAPLDGWAAFQVV